MVAIKSRKRKTERRAGIIDAGVVAANSVGSGMRLAHRVAAASDKGSQPRSLLNSGKCNV